MDRFGTYYVEVSDYYNENFKQNFSFRMKVNVRKELSKQEKEEEERLKRETKA